MAAAFLLLSGLFCHSLSFFSSFFCSFRFLLTELFGSCSAFIIHPSLSIHALPQPDSCYSLQLLATPRFYTFHTSHHPFCFPFIILSCACPCAAFTSVLVALSLPCKLCISSSLAAYFHFCKRSSLPIILHSAAFTLCFQPTAHYPQLDKTPILTPALSSFSSWHPLLIHRDHRQPLRYSPCSHTVTAVQRSPSTALLHLLRVFTPQMITTRS